MEAREKLVKETTESIFTGFSKSVSRVVALFESPREAFEKFISPEICDALNMPVCMELEQNISSETILIDKGEPAYYGETRDISLLLGRDKTLSFEETIKAVYASANAGNAKRFFSGDYVLISAEVPAVNIDGYQFDAVNIKNARLVVTETFTDSVMFNFEDILFRAPIEKKNKNEGGFSNSLLAKYLNEHFLKYVFGGVKDYLFPNKDGLKVSLPTRTDVFGSNEEYPEDVNWGTHLQRHSYFRKCTNRIKVEHSDPDNTWAYWTSTPYSSTSYSYFVYVSNYGYVNSYGVNGTGGGVSPAICVAPQR